MSETPRMYDEMPLSQLTKEYEQWAERMAGESSDETEVRGTGLLLRAYVYMFTIGPLRNELELLPEPATDGLDRVAAACLKMLETSREFDSEPIYRADIPVEQTQDGQQYYDPYYIIMAAQTGLESATESPKEEELEHLKDNEFAILSGQYDPEGEPIRRMYGPSEQTKEAVRDLALMASEQFSIVAGGMEFTIPEDDKRTWNQYKNQLAGLMQSSWQNPLYAEPEYSDQF